LDPIRSDGRIGGPGLIISAALIGLMYYVLKTAAEYITKQDDKENNRKLAKKEE
jgi:hypothetical protein